MLCSSPLSPTSNGLCHDAQSGDEEPARALVRRAQGFLLSQVVSLNSKIDLRRHLLRVFLDALGFMCEMEGREYQVQHRFETLSRIALGSAIIAAIPIVAVSVLLLDNTYSESVITNAPCFASGADGTLSSLAIERFKRLKISGAYLIAKGGVVLAQGSCGISDPETEAPMTSVTKLNIGSVAKQFTGFLLFQLKRENRLKLEDRISKYIPELSGRPMGAVTLGQLMSMRSGMPNILPLKDFVGLQSSNRIRTQDEVIRQIAELDLLHEPGARFAYSNLGYSLLGVVISRIDDRPWAESLKRRIFIPFGMIHSTSEGDVPERPEKLAVGLLPFRLLSGTWFLSLPHWNYSMIKGAGGIVSTVDDLHLWNEGLTKRAELDPSFAEEYFPSGAPSDENYAFGWFRSEIVLDDGRKIETVNHGGEDPGYCAANMRLPDSDVHFVLATNSDYCAFREDAYRELTRPILSYLSSRFVRSFFRPYSIASRAVFRAGPQ